MFLETRRLRLRDYRPDDLDDLEAILGDPEAMRYYPAPFSRDDSRKWIERQLERYERDGFGLWATELKATGEFVGNCGLVTQVVDGIPEVEVGWHVKRSLWGQGLAPEAAAACRDHAFGSLGLRRIISLIQPINVPSQRVAEKIGMSIARTTMHANLLHYVYLQKKFELDATVRGD